MIEDALTTPDQRPVTVISIIQTDKKRERRMAKNHL
jgi:hypothetical protein